MTSDLLPINDHDSRLAVELAVGISPVKEILKRHGLTSGQLKAKMSENGFRSMVKEARRIWSSDLSAKERIRLKSQILVEDSLLGLYQLFHDGNLSATARLDAYKAMAKTADVDTPEKVIGPTGGRVVLNLNFGNDDGNVVKQPISIEADVIPGDGEDA